MITTYKTAGYHMRKDCLLSISVYQILSKIEILKQFRWNHTKHSQKVCIFQKMFQWIAFSVKLNSDKSYPTLMMVRWCFVEFHSKSTTCFKRQRSNASLDSRVIRFHFNGHSWFRVACYCSQKSSETLKNLSVRNGCVCKLILTNSVIT